MEILDKLKKSTYDLFDLHKKQFELMLKLLDAFHIKEYKIKNPDKTSVVLAVYYIKDIKTKVVSELPVYECVDSKDHKRLDRLQKKYFSQYHKLELRSYCLKNIKIDKDDKMLACLQEEISRSLNR